MLGKAFKFKGKTLLLSRKKLAIVSGLLLAALIIYIVGGSPIVGASATMRDCQSTASSGTENSFP